MRILDADGSGSLSSGEIALAAAALSKLDRDKDGMITKLEVREYFTSDLSGNQFRKPRRRPRDR